MIDCVDFPFIPENVSTSLNLRCRVLNALDGFGHRFGGAIPLPGDELDVRQACLQFVRFKDTLDQTLQAPVNSYRSTFKFTKPYSYVKLMLPGVELSFESEDVTEMVDPEEVIGCPWRLYSPPVDPGAVMDKLNSPRNGYSDRAEYSRLCDLPLYIAGEGKNRVELFRTHRRKIAADVRRCSISKSPILCRDLSGKRWLSFWMNNYRVSMFAAVPFPSIALPIYRLLGVQIRNERMPVEEDEVERSLLSSIHVLTEAVAVP